MSIENNAMSYENLIMTAHQCGRCGVAGADADDFRRLQNREYTFKKAKDSLSINPEKVWNESYEEKAAEFYISLGEISAYIRTAIGLFKKNNTDKFTDDQVNELEEVETMLDQPDFNKINQAVSRAEKVFSQVF